MSTAITGANIGVGTQRLIDASTAVIDLEVLKAFNNIKSDDGANIVIELIDLYLHSASQRIETLVTAVKDGNADLIKQVAHTLKGSSSTLGLLRMARACQQLEEAASGSRDDVSALLQLLQASFEEAKPSLIAERNRRVV